MKSKVTGPKSVVEMLYVIHVVDQDITSHSVELPAFFVNNHKIERLSI